MYNKPLIILYIESETLDNIRGLYYLIPFNSMSNCNSDGKPE